MSRVQTGQKVTDNPDDLAFLAKNPGWMALVFDASEEAVQTVIEAAEHDDDGRSQWVWVRLPNGDLILGVYPQGDTYFAIEGDLG